MDSCDVLIVGGGPAGSSCAWGLRHSGLNVLILDKQVFPRDKVCGGWITPAVLTDLGIDTLEYSRDRVLQPITSFRVGCIGGSIVESDFGEAVSYGIRRREFDDYLLRRSGAKLQLGTALTRLEQSPSGWVANDRIQARVVVGAGGHFCPVARLVGAKKGAEPAVVAQETEFEMDALQLAGCRIRKDTPELYFCRDMKGYGWCFRKGDVLNIGLGRADPHRLSAHVGVFLDFLKLAGRISFDVPPQRGHAYLLEGTSTRTIVGDGILLIGDAAGLAYSQSGEGIRPAVESGLLAAKSILASDASYDAKRLDSYPALLARRRRPWSMGAGRYIPSQWIGFLGRSLLKSRWFVRDVVLDEWFLHAGSSRDLLSLPPNSSFQRADSGAHFK
jgi:geranylgeranyl reductase family protein